MEENDKSIADKIFLGSGGGGKKVQVADSKSLKKKKINE
jgi:hypothetical protein